MSYILKIIRISVSVYMSCEYPYPYSYLYYIDYQCNKFFLYYLSNSQFLLHIKKLSSTF